MSEQITRKLAQGGEISRLDVHIGSRIRLRRIELGMSLRGLGAELGLSYQQIQEYEQGISRLKASSMFDVACILNIPIGFFFSDELKTLTLGNHSAAETPKPFSNSVDVNLTKPEAVELVRAFYSITDMEFQKNVFELITSAALKEEKNDMQAVESFEEISVARVALSSSQSETKAALTDLAVSVAALGASRKKVDDGETALAAGEVVNKGLRRANSLLSSDKVSYDIKAAANLEEISIALMALSTSQSETRAALTDLAASVVALGLSRKKVDDGETALAAGEVVNKGLRRANSLLSSDKVSNDIKTAANLKEISIAHVALSSSQLETKAALTDLAASVAALGASRKKVDDGETALAAGEVVNKGLRRANSLLSLDKASLEKLLAASRLENQARLH